VFKHSQEPSKARTTAWPLGHGAGLGGVQEHVRHPGRQVAADLLVGRDLQVDEQSRAWSLGRRVLGFSFGQVTANVLPIGQDLHTREKGTYSRGHNLGALEQRLRLRFLLAQFPGCRMMLPEAKPESEQEWERRRQGTCASQA